MKRLCLRLNKRWQIALGVLLLPPFAWVALVTLVPTDCARQKIAERLSRSSGRKVTLGQIRVGLGGGVGLGDLAIGAPGSGDDPWLRIGEASINVSLVQLLFGQIEPTEVNVSGLQLRVVRRNDGSLELADLLVPDSSISTVAAAGNEPCDCAGLEIRVTGSTVVVIDEPSGTRLEFTGVEGRGTSQGCQASITELRGMLNGGRCELAAQFDRSEAAPRYEGQLRLRGVALGPGMNALSYLVPVLAGKPAGVEGTLTLDLYLRGQGLSRDALRQSLVGRGRLGLDPVELDGSRLLSGLADLFNLPLEGRAGDVWADFTVKDGRVASENLTVSVARVPVIFTGWTDFNGMINYRLRAEGLVDKLPPEALNYLRQLKPELKADQLADVKIQGTVDALNVTANGMPLLRPDSGRADDRRRLRDIGRRVHDQLLR